MRVPENKPVLEINKNLFMLLFTLLMLRKKNQLMFTYLNSTIERLEKGAKYV